MPSSIARSILTVPWAEMGYRIAITCAKTNFSANVKFYTKVSVIYVRVWMLSAYARSIQTEPLAEMGDKIATTCAKTNFSTNVTFHTKVSMMCTCLDAKSLCQVYTNCALCRNGRQHSNHMCQNQLLCQFHIPFKG